jgi:transposase InsO family protein
LPIAPNLVERNFTTQRPDEVWTTDITYIATDAGWLYLTVLLDLYSRQVVGWSMKELATNTTVCRTNLRKSACN